MQRRPSRSVVKRGSGAIAGPVARALCRAHDLASERAIRRRLVQPVDVDPLIGARQQRLIGEEAHFVPVSGDTRRDRGMALRFRGARVPAGHPDAGDEPAQVPLPRAGMRLVEVVQVDDEVAFRGSVEAEVTQVGIAADDRRDAGRRQMSDVLGHHDGRAAQETVGRRHHAADPDRDQPLQPALMRMHDLLDRVGPVRRRFPVAERTAVNALAQAPAEFEPLGARHRPAAQRAVAVAVRVRQDDVPRGSRVARQALCVRARMRRWLGGLACSRLVHSRSFQEEMHERTGISTMRPEAIGAPGPVLCRPPAPCYGTKPVGLTSG